MILKVATFRPYLFPTTLLYRSCEVLTVRQLFVLNILLRQHSNLIFDPDILNKRRKHAVSVLPKQSNTSFIQRFFIFLGPYLYNKVNKLIPIYSLNKISLKKVVTKWLLTLSYDETEDLLKILK